MNFRIHIPSLVAIAILTTSTISTSAGATEIAKIDRKEPVSFTREILPILQANCVACHSSTKARGDLILETPEAMLEGGDEGPSIVPGKPEESFLLKVAAGLEKPVMPPKKNKVGARALNPKELGLLSLWIQQGAKMDEGGGAAKVEFHALPKGPHPIYSTAISADGDHAACGRANEIFVYDLRSKTDVGSKALVTKLVDPSLSKDGPYKDRSVAHLDHVQSLAFHPDGDLLASGGFRTVKLWRRPSASVRHTLEDVTGAVTVNAVSGDGAVLAAAGPTGCVSVWGVADGQRRATFAGHPTGVTALSLSDDGKALVTAGNDGWLRHWNVDDGKLVGSIEIGKALTVARICAEGKSIVAAADDNVLRVWNVPTGEQRGEAAKPTREFAGHAKKVTQLESISSADARVVSASEDGLIILWNSADAKEVKKLQVSGAVRSIDVLADGKRIAAVAADQSIKLWNAEDGKEIALSPSDAREGRKLARLERQGKLLDAIHADWKKKLEAATKDRDKKQGAIKKANEELEKAKKDLEAKKKALAEAEKGKDKGKIDKAKKDTQGSESNFANRERILKEANSDVERANTKIGELEKTIASAAEEAAAPKKVAEELEKAAEAKKKDGAKGVWVACAFVPNPPRLIAVSAESKLFVFGTDDGAQQGILDVDVREGTQLASGGGVVAISDGTKITRVADVAADWVLERTIGGIDTPAPFVDRIVSLSFSNDGTRLVCGGGEPSRTGELTMIDISDGSVVWRLDDAHSDTICGVEFSAEDKYIATGGADKFARVFDAKTGKRIRFFEGHTGHVLDVSWQSDSKTIASCGADNVIKVWNVETGEAKRTIGGFGKEVTSISFIGDKAETVSCSGDASVRMHRAGDGNNFRNFGGTKDFMYAVDVSSDGKFVVAGGHTGTLIVWNGADGKELSKFEPPVD